MTPARELCCCRLPPAVLVSTWSPPTMSSFNPSLEDQAADRVYRVGQKRDVHIHSLFCTDTIEEHVRQIQAGKRRMAKGIMNTAHIEKDSDALRDIFLDMLASS